MFKSLMLFLAVLALWSCGQRVTNKQGDFSVQYYTFEIDGHQVGYYEESNIDGVLLLNAVFAMHGEVYENPFGLKHENGRVLAYKFGDAEWMEFSQGENVFPTSALVLLVPKVLAQGEISYARFIEGDGKVAGEAVLKREGADIIQEYIDGKPGCRVVLRDGKICEYNWGGTAKSVLCNSRQEAVLGTQWETVQVK